MNLCLYCAAVEVADGNLIGCDNCWEVRRRLAQFLKNKENRAYTLDLIAAEEEKINANDRRPEA